MNQHQKRTQADKKKLRPPRPLLIVLQDLDFAWEQEEVDTPRIRCRALPLHLLSLKNTSLFTNVL